jgi:hypothetical protein
MGGALRSGIANLILWAEDVRLKVNKNLGFVFDSGGKVGIGYAGESGPCEKAANNGAADAALISNFSQCLGVDFY